MLVSQGFQYYKRRNMDKKQFIKFGKEGAKGEILGYILTQGIVNRLAVADDVAANLISVYEMTKQGVQVVYDAKSVRIVHNNTTLLTGVVGDDNLYHMDLVQLLLTKIPGNQPRRHEAVRKAYVAKATTKETVHIIRKAMDLHRNLKHLPYSTMADQIELRAWTGIDPNITPALLRMLAKRKNCIICATNRWNQQPGGTDTTDNYQPGEAASIDYIGKYTLLSRGFSGAFVITDLATDRYKVYATNDKTECAQAVKK